jgi:hypothetical protein
MDIERNLLDFPERDYLYRSMNSIKLRCTQSPGMPGECRHHASSRAEVKIFPRSFLFSPTTNLHRRSFIAFSLLLASHLPSLHSLLMFSPSYTLFLLNYFHHLFISFRRENILRRAATKSPPRIPAHPAALHLRVPAQAYAWPQPNPISSSSYPFVTPSKLDSVEPKARVRKNQINENRLQWRQERRKA